MWFRSITLYTIYAFCLLSSFTCNARDGFEQLKKAETLIEHHDLKKLTSSLKDRDLGEVGKLWIEAENLQLRDVIKKEEFSKLESLLAPFGFLITKETTLKNILDFLGKQGISAAQIVNKIEKMSLEERKAIVEAISFSDTFHATSQKQQVEISSFGYDFIHGIDKKNQPNIAGIKNKLSFYFKKIVDALVDDANASIELAVGFLIAAGVLLVAVVCIFIAYSAPGASMRNACCPGCSGV